MADDLGVSRAFRKDGEAWLPRGGLRAQLFHILESLLDQTWIGSRVEGGLYGMYDLGVQAVSVKVRPWRILKR